MAMRCILTAGRELKMEILDKIRQLQRSLLRSTQDRLQLPRTAVKSVFPPDMGHAATPPPLPPPPRQEAPSNEITSRLSSTASGTPLRTVLGQTVVLKGELSANEDLLIEGQFEGTISLEQYCVTVGANGQVKAEIRARQAVILGTLTGKVAAKERVEIHRSGHLVGDLTTSAVAIEEGACFKGSIEILVDGQHSDSQEASYQPAKPKRSKRARARRRVEGTVPLHQPAEPKRE